MKRTKEEGQRAKRTRLPDSIAEVLNKAFAANPYPSQDPAWFAQFSNEEITLTPEQVKVWFYNARRRSVRERRIIAANALLELDSSSGSFLLDHLIHIGPPRSTVLRDQRTEYSWKDSKTEPRGKLFAFAGEADLARWASAQLPPQTLGWLEHKLRFGQEWQLSRFQHSAALWLIGKLEKQPSPTELETIWSQLVGILGIWRLYHLINDSIASSYATMYHSNPEVPEPVMELPIVKSWEAQEDTL